jgi:hypothetical protein
MADHAAPGRGSLIPSQAARAYVYRVLLAASPIVTAYGIANGNTVALWLGLAQAVLGLGLATANTSTKG